MRRRLRYFRLFGLMTIIFVIVVGIYLGSKNLSEPSPVNGEPNAKVSKRIVIAATDLMPRTLLTSDLLEEKEVEILPEGAFSSKDEVINRLSITLIRRGEPIFRQSVTPPLKDLSAAYLIPTGQVGMALPISRPETVPPLKVGDYISIHAVFAGMKVRTIVQRVLVLAVNNQVNEISIASSPQISEPQQNKQQQQTQMLERGQLILFVALSPREAKAVALAMDSGATFYYTLHSAPISPLSLSEFQRDINLQELTGSQQVASLIVRKQHGELLNLVSRINQQTQPFQPEILEPLILQLSRTEGSLQNLSRRIERLESGSTQKFSKNPEFVSDTKHQIIGIIGDQKVTFTIHQSSASGGMKNE